MAPLLRWFALMGLLAVAATLTVELRQTRAQTLNEGWNKLEEKYNAGPRNLAYGFLKGQRVDPNDKNHTEAIDLLAKTQTYGVYLRKLDAQTNAIAKEFDTFSNEIDRDILGAKNPQSMQTFAEIFRDKVRVRALEVIQFKNAQPIHKLHNARLLAETAKLGQPELADTLITVLKDPQQNQGVRYCMLRGLATLIPHLQQNPQQQAKCAAALVELLQQLKAPHKNATPEEVEGFHVYRREAVRALAKIRTPALDDKVRPALVLARFAGNDASIQPPPRVDERVEAAIGLARVQTPPKDKQYQADYAAGLVAKALGVMVQAAESDRSGERGEEKRIRLHPWRVLAGALKDALEELKKNNDKNKYVVMIADKGMVVLNQVVRGESVNSNEQTWWTSPESDSPSKELFQGSADSAIKPGSPTQPQTEKK